MKPVISIIIPTFNRCRILHRTLDSVFTQSFTGWECIIVDDGSTDNTKDLALDYCSRDSRFKYLVNTHKKGAQGARNTGLFASESEWILFFDSDNIMHRDCLETLVGAIRPDISVCKCFSLVVDTDTGLCIDRQNWIADNDIQKALFDGKTYVDFNQEIIRRSKLLEIGGLDENCPALQEFDTNIRLSRICSYHTVQEYLVDYCTGGSDTISSNIRKQVKGKLYNLIKYRKEWLEDKRNADRAIYELHDKLRRSDSVLFRIACYFRLFWHFPAMIPYYFRKIVIRIFESISCLK